MADEINGYGFRAIGNGELRLADVPGPDAEFWGAIDLFALTFDGYALHGDSCGDIANRAGRHYSESGGLPGSVSDLRTCLFFEQRRWRHFGEHPDDEAMAYIRALLDAIRGRVAAGSAA